MVDTANSKSDRHLQQGPSKRAKRSDGNSASQTSVSSDSDVISNGFHGYEQFTQSVFSQTLKRFVFRTVMPIFLILFAPSMVFLIWYTVIHCDGSFSKMLSVFSQRSFLDGMFDIIKLVNYPSAPILWILGLYSLYALAMMKILPGKMVTGPLTPKGNVPEYKDNGFVFFLLTIALFWILTLCLKPYGLSPSIIYDRFDEVLLALTAFSFVFCLFLYFKGIISPSSTDCGTSGNIIFDYYWGTELYPRILGFDVKVFTNCRFGMMVWALLTCVHAVKSHELYGFVDSMFVSVFLQLLYITKFFWWEAGYLRTIDIMVDRAGYYICWGCLVYVPGLYASVSFYLVNHPVHLGPYTTILFLFLGALSIYINYEADMQKQDVRGADGNCLVWGRKPDFIRAKYHLENGEERESILLASGWWGLSRHFHYIPEIMLAFFWSVPALFTNVMPYSYVIWLVILLTHRSYRDDTKCGNKYGQFWRQYCKKVPHKIVPYLF